MAGKKENIKALFSNSRSRVIILFTVILLLITVVIGVIKMGSSTADLDSAVRLSRGGQGVQGTPGSLNQTAQYAALQETQNVEQAQQASKTGGSAIPTIIRTQAFGEGSVIYGQKEGEGGVSFTALTNDDSGDSQKFLWVQNVKNAQCSKESVQSALDQGAVLSDLKDACSCTKLQTYGYKLSELEPLCTCAELKLAGFDIVQLKAAGFTAGRLRLCGFVACAEKGVGFTAQQMKDAGFSDGELKGAGFSDREIARAGGLPDGMTAEDVRKAGCNVEALTRLRAAGVTAAAIRHISGCSVEQLIAAGFTAQDLGNAGYSAAEIKSKGQVADCSVQSLTAARARGVSAATIKQTTGCSANAMKDAGYSAADLKNAGFSAAELKNAGFGLNDLKNAGFGAKELNAAGFTAKQLKDAGFSAAQLKGAGLSDGELKGAGFSDRDIANAGGLPDGMTAEDVRKAGCNVEALTRMRAAGVTAAAIRNISGCSADQLTAAGFTGQDLGNAGYSAAEIKDKGQAADCSVQSLSAARAKGVSAATIKQTTGCSAKAMKDAGYSAADLKNAGFSAAELKNAGFGLNDLKNAGFGAKELNAAGFTAKQLKDAGFSAAQLKDAGLSDGELKGAGFSDREIANAGGLPDGMTAEDVRKAGCNVEALTRLRAAGVTAAAIRNISGCSVDQLTAAGFTAQDLGNAGYSTAEIKSKGQVADCSVQSLAAARAKGVSAATIKQTMGCSAKAMKDAGYSAADLKNAGFSAAELKNAGFGLNDLKNAGFGAKELNAAGFTAQQLKDAGFSAAQLKGAGFNAAELKAAGIGADELRKAGFSAKDVKDAGFTQDQIKKAGYANQELKDAGFSAMPGLDTITPSSGVPSTIANFPALEGITPPAQASVEDANAKRLDDIRSQQEKQMAAQRYQQKIQQRGSAMLAGANQLLQGWKTVPQQVYTAGTEKEGNEKGMSPGQSQGPGNHGLNGGSGELGSADNQSQGVAVIKTGDILFAVIDTSVNSDEPGPILATIVSGRLKGSKLIGSFNLPNRADKMIVTFNTLSVLGADKTVSITAFAIDPNTARTALSSQTDHHYLSRYGSLFASTFLEGFGNAFQSSNTTITIGGTGGTTDTTVQSGIGRSTMDNAVIGLATLGKAWGQLAAQNMTRPTTVQLYAGTGVGILFTQDLRLS